MLIFTRKVGESLMIGDDVTVTITEVKANQVRIGIKAPNYVPIFRQEIVERMVAAGEIEPLECLEPPQPASV